MYEVVRMIKDSSDIVVNEWKEHLRADTTFRKDGILYFVNKVEEPAYEIINTNTNTESLTEKLNEESIQLPDQEEII